eukprot:IDg22043t1
MCEAKMCDRTRTRIAQSLFCDEFCALFFRCGATRADAESSEALGDTRVCDVVQRYRATPHDATRWDATSGRSARSAGQAHAGNVQAVTVLGMPRRAPRASCEGARTGLHRESLNLLSAVRCVERVFAAMPVRRGATRRGAERRCNVCSKAVARACLMLRDKVEHLAEACTASETVSRARSVPFRWQYKMASSADASFADVAESRKQSRSPSGAVSFGLDCEYSLATLCLLVDAAKNRRVLLTRYPHQPVA